MPTTTPLTDQQIDTLFAFVKSKYVDFYDVQVELVDHLASEVEQRMAAEPNVTFDAALQQVYRGFGIFGFSDVVDQKWKAVARRNMKMWWQFFKGLFRLPMAVASLIGAFLLAIAFDQLKVEVFLVANGVLALLADLAGIYYFFLKQPRKGFKLSAYQYNNVLHFGATFNLYQSYFISYTMILPFMSGYWLLLIPLICWISWINFAACVLSFDSMIKEQRRLYPLAFA